MLVDSHCHLNFPEYNGILDEIVLRAQKNDVKVLQSICTRISEFETILNIANKYDGVYCSVGVHPNNVEETDLVTAEELISLASNDKVIGLGETGLDYYRQASDHNKQQQSFIQHIKASQATNLPVIVHTRSADDDTISILEKEMKEKKFPGLIHCFSTSRELAYKAMDLGMYISISGIVTFKNATDLQQIVKDLPLDRLLVETDAPFLAPLPYRGKVNEPGYTKHTAEFIAQLKGISFEEIAAATTDNFFKLFSSCNPK